MSFGKKKSALPQQKRRVTQRVVQIPRANTASRPQPSAERTTDLDAMLTLTLKEVWHYAAGVCEGRGYPEDSAVGIGLAAAWLAARNMPNLAFVAKTIFNNLEADLRQMGPQGRNGVLHLPCPLFGSAFLGGYVDELVGAGAGKAVNMTVAGPAILMASRLSDHAVRHKVALHMAISPLEGDLSNPTVVTVYQDEISVQPGTGSLYDPSHVTLRVVPATHIPPADSFTSPQTHRKTVIVQKVLLEMIDMGRKAAGFPPVLHIPKNVKTIPGTLHMKEDTKDFFRRSIQKNFELQGFFAALSKGDISMLVAAVTNAGGEHKLEEAVFATSLGSPNDKFYNCCKTLGWMADHYDKTMGTYNIQSYTITKTGRMGLSVLMERYLMKPAA